MIYKKKVYVAPACLIYMTSNLVHIVYHLSLLLAQAYIFQFSNLMPQAWPTRIFVAERGNKESVSHRCIVDMNGESRPKNRS